MAKLPSYYEPNRAAIAAEWQKLGWNQTMIAGMLGRASRESSFNPGIANPGDGADGSDSEGLFQWNSTRNKALKNFARREGLKWNDPVTQARFTHYEITGKNRPLEEGEKATGAEAATWTRLKNATDVQKAVDAAMLYTRPEGTILKGGKLSPRTGLHYKETLANAKKFAGIPTNPEDAMQAVAMADPNIDAKSFNADQTAQNQKIAESAQIVADANSAVNTDNQGIRPPTDTNIGELIKGFMPTAVTPKPAPTAPGIQDLAQLFRPRLQWDSL